MISRFPKFGKLALSDKFDLQKIILKHPSHSDFNLAGLWSYDTGSEVEVSILFDNLVMQSRDYVTKKPFYSFIGSTKVTQTIEALFEYERSIKVDTEIKLISEYIVSKIIDTSKLVITEDRDNFDYILSIANLISYQGNSLRAKRNFLNRFHRFHDAIAKVKVIRLPDKETHYDVLSLFDKWVQIKKKDHTETQIERIAMERLLKVANLFELYAVCVYAGKELIGFSINEVIQENHGVIHFEKADTAFVGIFEYIKQQSAEHLRSLNCAYINYEQDLGIEGLRKAKLSYQPIALLKKYIVRPRFTSGLH